MKALYSRTYLDHISFDDMLVPFDRYLYRLEHQRKEIAKLKFHEKVFLFKAMNVYSALKIPAVVIRMESIKRNYYYRFLLLLT